MEIKDDDAIAEAYARNIRILHGLLTSGAEYEEAFFGRTIEETPSLNALLNGLEEKDMPYVHEKITEAINLESERKITVAPDKSKNGKNK